MTDAAALPDRLPGGVPVPRAPFAPPVRGPWGAVPTSGRGNAVPASGRRLGASTVLPEGALA
ncbi:hypothetical protein [Streptomyces sasae]|uniref:hypothetical protein n=1 Tax=Streptomyces sasae TaxID=1266772 RepID=UPI00292FFB6B|nr:hypothetical protein [Streptomyces sasae]